MARFRVLYGPVSRMVVWGRCLVVTETSIRCSPCPTGPRAVSGLFGLRRPPLGRLCPRQLHPGNQLLQVGPLVQPVGVDRVAELGDLSHRPQFLTVLGESPSIATCLQRTATPRPSKPDSTPAGLCVQASPPPQVSSLHRVSSGWGKPANGDGPTPTSPTMPVYRMQG